MFDSPTDQWGPKEAPPESDGEAGEAGEAPEMVQMNKARRPSLRWTRHKLSAEAGKADELVEFQWESVVDND